MNIVKNKMSRFLWFSVYIFCASLYIGGRPGGTTSFSALILLVGSFDP